MNFNTPYSVSSLEALAKGPNAEELKRAKSLYKPIIDAANEYRGLSEATEESLAAGAQIVDPYKINARLSEVIFAAKQAFGQRTGTPGASFTDDEIGFMKTLELAHINLNSDPNGGLRRSWTTGHARGKDSNGSSYMSSTMERVNSENRDGSRLDRFRVSIEHNGI